MIEGLEWLDGLEVDEYIGVLVLCIAVNALSPLFFALLIAPVAEWMESERGAAEKIRLGHRLNLDELPQPCRELFRFEKNDIYRLTRALRIPQPFVTRNSHRFENWEVLCLLLRRLAYPVRLGDLVPLFGRHKSQLSEGINELVTWLDREWGNKVFWDQEFVDSHI